METWFSDGIGKILFVTPSHGSKITGSQINIGQKGCPMDSIDIQSSDGIKWSPSMSIEKTLQLHQVEIHCIYLLKVGGSIVI